MSPPHRRSRRRILQQPKPGDAPISTKTRYMIQFKMREEGMCACVPLLSPARS